jgi:hypothetical protein
VRSFANTCQHFHWNSSANRDADVLGSVRAPRAHFGALAEMFPTTVALLMINRRMLENSAIARARSPAREARALPRTSAVVERRSLAVIFAAQWRRKSRSLLKVP